MLVHNGRIIARGMNATNMTRNGTRHAELMCLNALLSYWDDVSKADEGPINGSGSDDDSDCESAEDYDDEKKEYTEDDWERVDPSKGHLFPYGQKLHPARIVNPDIVRECSLYVTVEPCIMCASMLRQYGIMKVYFGAANDKFGGTGGVLRVHMNSKPDEPVKQTVTYIETYVTSMMSRPKRASRPQRIVAASSADELFGDPSSDDVTAETADDLDDMAENKVPTTTITRTILTTDNVNPPVVRRASTIPIAEGAVPARDEGHGGNVEAGFAVEGGWGRNKAVFLLRQFYVQENGRAPAPRKKEGRAQRLVQQIKSEVDCAVKLPSAAEEQLAEIETGVSLHTIPPAAVVPAENGTAVSSGVKNDANADMVTADFADTANIANISDD